MKNYIRSYDVPEFHFDSSKIIEIFESNSDNHVRRDTDTYAFTELNFMDIQDKEQKKIVQSFYDLLPLYLSMYRKDEDVHNTQFPYRYGMEEIRIKKYNKWKDCFKCHVDVGSYASAKRFLVCMMYLNDLTDNSGATFFPDLKATVYPAKNRLVFFPSTWTHLHMGRTPHIDDKYIMSTYLHYI